MYFFSYLVMLKAFDQMEMSKCKHVKKNNVIVTASRGRAVKVVIFSFSSGKFHPFGEISLLKLKNKEK